jgi:hypothetical protein
MIKDSTVVGDSGREQGMLEIAEGAVKELRGVPRT